MLMQDFLFAEKKITKKNKIISLSDKLMPSSIKNPNKPYLCYIELG